MSEAPAERAVTQLPNAAAAENVVVKVAGGAIGDEADQHHPEDVHQKGDEHWGASCHSKLRYVTSVSVLVTDSFLKNRPRVISEIA